MNNEKGLEILDRIHWSFKESGIIFFIHAGTLLGLYRDKKLICHDTDIDIGIPHHDISTIAIIKEKMHNLGFVLHREFYYNKMLTEQSYIKSNFLVGDDIKVDIFYFVHNANNSYHFTYVEKYPCTFDIMNALISEYSKIDKIIQYKIDGHTYNIPENTEKILSENYGDWKTPVKDWLYYKAPNCEYIGEGQTISWEDSVKQEDISFVIPYMEKPDRKHLFEFSAKRLKIMFPKSEILISKFDHPEGFNRGMALNKGALKATRKYLVLVDADVIFERFVIFNAIKLLNKSNWVIPYTEYASVTEEETKRIIENTPDINIINHMPIKARIYSHNPLGAITVIKRRDFINIGGFDERLFGWGYDDNIFAHKANVLLGEYNRMEGQIFHLWHERINKAKALHKNLFEEVSKITDKEEMKRYYNLN